MENTKKLAIFMADGCEEIEGLTVVDLLRRAGLGIDMVAIGDGTRVRGAHGIVFEADRTADGLDPEAYAGVILPGGMPGTEHLRQSAAVRRAVAEADRAGKLVAAICAAPTVLADCGVLEGRKATCFPGLEGKLAGAEFRAEAVVEDGHVITSRGMGTAIPFGLALVAYLLGRERADALGTQIVYR